MRPAIDHTLLSPSGTVSKRARKAALQREHDRLFPSGFWDEPEKSQEQQRQDKADTLRRSAQTLRELASRGMSPTKHIKAAERLELQAQELVKATA